MVVDYSKWDALEVSDDEACESIDGAEVEMRNGLRVTRFEQPTSVSCDGQGWQAERGDAPAASKVAEPQEGTHPPPASKTHIKEPTSRGGHDDRHCWSQSAEDVRICLLLEPAARAKDLQVTFLDASGAAPGEFGAVKRLRVLRQGQDYLDLEFPFDLQSEPDSLFWEVKEAAWADHPPRPALCLDMKKKRDSDLVHVWWDRPFTTYAAVDLAGVFDAKQSARQSAFLQAWEEAHEEFRAKVKAQEPLEI